MKPRLLDLFCGAGGAAMGYHRAGFDVVGVDIEPQPEYPFAFISMDALEYVQEHGQAYDAIHASPPCQGYTRLSTLFPEKTYPMLIPAVREVLERLPLPYVIENTPGAPLINPLLLCGQMFGIRTFRHRLFELSYEFLQPQHTHGKWRGTGRGKGNVIPGPGQVWSPTGHFAGKKQVREVLGVGWMSRRQSIADSIPPAYTEFIGKQLMAVLP